MGAKFGHVVTQATREKLSIYHTGRKASEETRKKISDKNKGKVMSEESRRKISIANSNPSPETRLKISMRAKAHPSSKERMDKLHAMNKGNTYRSGTHVTEETKQKLRLANIGKTLSQEHRQKMSIARKGRIITPLHRYKIGIALSGDKSSTWNGGSSFEPYCQKFTNRFKERVRAFFGYQCQECGYVWKYGETKLAVHHVNFKKDSCCNGYTKPLFVPLCSGTCHVRTNFNREFWEYWFTEMIERLYNGKCYFSEEEYMGMLRDVVK